MQFYIITNAYISLLFEAGKKALEYWTVETFYRNLTFSYKIRVKCKNVLQFER